MMSAILKGFNDSQDRYRSIQAAQHQRTQDDELFTLKKKAAELDIKQKEMTGEWSKTIGELARNQLKEQTKLKDAKDTIDEHVIGQALQSEKDNMDNLRNVGMKIAIDATKSSTPQNYNGTVTIPGVGQAPFNNVAGPMQYTTADNPIAAQPAQEQQTAQPIQSNKKVVNDIFAQPVPSHSVELSADGPKLVKQDRKEYYLNKIQEIMASGERPLSDREQKFFDKELGGAGNVTSIANVDVNSIPKVTNEDERAQALGSLPVDVAENVQAAGEYRLDASKVYGLRNNSGDRAKFDALINRIYPGWDMKKYSQRQAYQNDTAKGKTRDQIVSLNTLAQHSQTFISEIEALMNTNIKPENALINFAKDITGDASITDLKFAKEIVYGELQKLITGAAVTQEGMRRVNEIVSENAGYDQLLSNARLLKIIAKGRIEPLRQQYKNIMGEEENGQIEFPETKAIFDNKVNKSENISLPPEVRTTSEAVKWLTENKAMSKDEAINWLRSQ